MSGNVLVASNFHEGNGVYLNRKLVDGLIIIPTAVLGGDIEVKETGDPEWWMCQILSGVSVMVNSESLMDRFGVAEILVRGLSIGLAVGAERLDEGEKIVLENIVFEAYFS